MTRLSLFGFLALTAMAAGAPTRTVRIWTEQAPSLNGPWTRVDPAVESTDANGNVLLPGEAEAVFRTKIEWIDGTAGQTIPLLELPPAVRSLAEREIKTYQAIPTDQEPWPEDAVLGDGVPVFDGAGEDRTTPAFILLKVRRATPFSPSAVPGQTMGLQPGQCRDADLGFIMVALDSQEIPVPEMSTRGITPAERLAKFVGSRDFRLIRFSGDYWAAEDRNGRLLASMGSQPWRPDPAIVTQNVGPLIWQKEEDSPTETEPVVPTFSGQPYESYEALKTDFRQNPVYVKYREFRARRAAAEWDIEKGIIP